MTDPRDSHDEPLQELAHPAVPGYGRAFAVAFAVMALYLLLILYSSPGPAEKHHGHEKPSSSDHETEHAH